jgi:uncharacterized protein DUF6647
VQLVIKVKVIRFIFFRTILCCLAFSGIDRVYAEDVQNHSKVDLDVLLIDLSKWLEKNYDFKKENIISPKIKIVSSHALCEITFNEKDIINNEVDCEKVLGLYQFNEKIIYINESVDLTKNVGKAIVLHELVHHYQFERGLTKNSSGYSGLEQLSFELESKYLAEKN